MIGNIVALIFVSIIVSIITEQLVIRRIQMNDGVIFNSGKCQLKPGYGKV